MVNLVYENAEVTQNQLEQIFKLVGSQLTCLVTGVGNNRKVRVVLQYRDLDYQQRVKEILKEQ